MRLRDLFKTNFSNDGSRSLFESILIPEVEKAFKDWKRNAGTNFVLIGGIALSFYVKPRTTTDVDILYFSKNEVPEKVLGFKRHRQGAFQHNSTHVEIEVLTPDMINMPVEVAKQILKTAQDVDGIKIASREGLIISKLKRFKLQDQADIEALLELGPTDFSSFSIPTEWQDKLNAMLNRKE